MAAFHAHWIPVQILVASPASFAHWTNVATVCTVPANVLSAPTAPQNIAIETAAVPRADAAPGNSCAIPDTHFTPCVSKEIMGVMAGMSPFPIAILNASILFLASCNELAVVSERAENSPSMLPAYLDESATLFKLSCTPSRFDKSGAMAPSDSFPNRSLNTDACLTLSSPRIAPNTFRIVSFALSCIPWATSSALSPNSFNAPTCDFVALSPAVSARIIFFRPVAATSDWMPEPTIEAPSAAISPAATPPTSPNGPMRVTTSEISGALAAVVLPK